MPKYLLFLWIVFGFLTMKPTAAIELGEITVASEINQILDAKVELRDINTDGLADWYIITADQDSYQAQGLQYIRGLHDRLVMEIVASASPPYIAVSSIAALNHRNFDLIMTIANGKENLSKTYRAALKEPPLPTPMVSRIMTSAEILNYLSNQLAAAQGISGAKAWGELKALTSNTNAGSAQNLASQLNAIDLDLNFVAGIKTMLNEQQKTIFNRIKEESGNTRAVSAALFGQQDFLILKALFAKATEHSLEEGVTKSQQLAFEKEQVAILENKLYELQHLKAQQDAAAKQARAELSAQKNQNKEFSFLNYQSWLDVLDWRETPLLSNAKIWLAATVFFGILLLLLSIRSLRTPKVQSVRRPVKVGTINAPLPGQAELEKLHASRTPHIYVNPSDKTADKNFEEQGDEITSKLNRAEAYIEMGEYGEARRLLEETEKQSAASQQLKRMRSLRDKME